MLLFWLCHLCNHGYGCKSVVILFGWWLLWKCYDFGHCYYESDVVWEGVGIWDGWWRPLCCGVNTWSSDGMVRQVLKNNLLKKNCLWQARAGTSRWGRRSMGRPEGAENYFFCEGPGFALAIFLQTDHPSYVEGLLITTLGAIKDLSRFHLLF